MPNEAEAIPDELKAPIGVADDLLVPPSTPVNTDSGAVLGKGDNGEEVNGTDASKKEESGEMDSQGKGEDSPGTVRFSRCFVLSFLISFQPKTEVAAGGGGPHGGLVGSSGPGGLLGFFQMYLTSSTDVSLPGDGPTATMHRREYPLSTVILVGLIAFLIGSLLRSLLSPADFIYVATDVGEAETANSVGGWREIRRLLELKYFVGGWDFQVAVVRRHLG